MNPEFMREGNAVEDFFAPSRIVVGGAPEPAERLLRVYEGIDAPRFRTSFEAAEAIKFVDNGFHALKITFANEIGRFAASSGIGTGELFELFLADTRLNLSGRYLSPGVSFGGPCLPKDVRALAASMERLGVDAPVLGHVLESNRRHDDFLFQRIVDKAGDRRRLLLVGLTFKPGSGDLRGSPLVELAQRLMAAGYDLSICDTDLGSAGQELLPASIRERLVEPPANTSEWDLVVLGKRQAMPSGVVAPGDVLDLGRF